MQTRWYKQAQLAFVTVLIMMFAYHIIFAQDVPATYVVQRGDVQDIVVFSGTWLPRDQQALLFDIAGTVQTVNAQVGDRVTAGTTLVQYSVADLQAQLEEAQADLAEVRSLLETEDSASAILDAQFSLADARLGLQQTRDAVPFTGINDARLALDAAQEALETAKRNYNNVIGDPTNDPGAVDSAYEGVKTAERGLASAQNAYWGAAQSFNLYDYSIIGAENSLLRTELSYQQLLSQVGTSEFTEIIQEAQTRVDQLTAEIARSSLVAPFTGVVLEVNVSRGDNVTAFEDIVTLALPEPLEIFANLSPEDAQRLQVGMLGVCQATGRPETAVQCIVRRMLGGNNFEAVRIAASFDNVQQGELIDISLSIGVRENVLWLPPEAIRTFQSRAFVVVQTPSGEEVVDVTLGLRTSERVEILSGLNEGDIVIAPEA